MAKVLCVLYDDPVDGYPKSYARDDVPKLERYPGGRPLPSPQAIDFTPGELLGSVSGELGLRKFLEGRGHTFVVTSDKDGADSVFERELPDAEIVISQPFWPAYLTAERIAKAPKLKLAITAGIGSDHVDLQAATERGITVAEVDVLEQHQRERARRHDDPRARAQLHPVVPDGRRRRLEHRRLRRALVRPRRHGRRHGRGRPHRHAPCCAASSRSTSSCTTPTATACRRASSASSSLTFHPDAESLVRVCDVVTINTPLHPETEHLFNDALIAKMKRGAYIVNTARGKICDATRSLARSRAASSPDTPATCGSRSRRRATIPGARCRTTA